MRRAVIGSYTGGVMVVRAPSGSGGLSVNADAGPRR